MNGDWMYVFGGWNGSKNQNSMYRLNLSKIIVILFFKKIVTFIFKKETLMWERLTPTTKPGVRIPNLRSHNAISLKCYVEGIDWYYFLKVFL